MELPEEKLSLAEIRPIRDQIAQTLIEKINLGEDIFWRHEEEIDPEAGSDEAEFNQVMLDIEKATIDNLMKSKGEAIFIHHFCKLNQIRVLTKEGIQLTTKFAIQDFGFEAEEAKQIKAVSVCYFDDSED